MEAYLLSARVHGLCGCTRSRGALLSPVTVPHWVPQVSPLAACIIPQTQYLNVLEQDGYRDYPIDILHRKYWHHYNVRAVISLLNARRLLKMDFCCSVCTLTGIILVRHHLT